MSRHTETGIPGPTQAGLVGLVAALENHGINLPEGERFELLTTIGVVLDPPEPPPSLLALDEHELQAWVRVQALHSLAVDVAHKRFAHLAVQGLADEMAGAIRFHVDAIVADLDAQFEPLFERARILRAAGVTEQATAADVITMDAETIAKWNEFGPVADQLDTLAELRFDLSRVALVAPATRTSVAGNRLWGACLGDPNLVYDVPGETPVSRWLRLAANPTIRLASPADLSDLDRLQLEVPDLNAGMLAAIAAHRATTTTDADDDDTDAHD